MSEWAMDNEQPHQELVKCVVVGDTAVGKTRLICARACNKQVSLGQLLSTHVPTVWAIDQYRIYKDVLERSWEVVDGVSVSLRLWDTFGDHEKDRRFAYGRSDVVLLCFSVGNPVSLRNCKAMWIPEIRRFCPNTPVVLVGCKNDLRYMYRDETYLSYFKDRSPFVRPTRECDIVMPDQARALAHELDVPYFETSVLTYYGVTAVFENVIRAALVARKQQRFWVAGLKRVQRPILQAPFCPPKPRAAEVYVSVSSLNDHLQNLYSRQAFTDVIFVTGSVGFSAHKFWLAAAAPSLHRLLDVEPASAEMGTRSSSESSIELIQMSTFGESNVGNFNEDTECLIQVETSSQGPRLPRLRDTNKDMWKRRFSCHIAAAPWENMSPSPSSSKSNPDHPNKTNYSKILSHPAVESVSIEQCEGLDHRGKPCLSQQTVVHLSKLVSPNAMRQCLKFVYTGNIDTRYCSLQELRQAAEFLELPELLAFTANIQSREEFLNNDLRHQYRQAIKRRLLDGCLSQCMYADVRFLLDDGTCPAHRAMVMARCDVLNAMFSGDFRESSAKVVEFPGVKTDTFRQLLHFLYTDGVPVSLQPSTCLPLIELANRLCLPRLVQLVESQVVQEMQRICEIGGDVMLECINLVEPCQIHNADQLADWCLTYLASNYNTICRKAPKLLKAMHSENQAYLARHRWPPVWYLKERDYYEKCVRQREREENGDKPLKRSRHNSGCLCFTGKSRRSDDVAYHSV